MGLDTTHGCWHGAYSAFSRWRNALAEAAGYPLVRTLDGYLEVKFIDWSALTDDNFAGKWDRTPEEPLVVLFAHSDCDGAIYPEHAGSLADRLESLLPALDRLGDGGGHIGSFRAKTEAFIAGLRAALSRGERVEFH